MIFSLGGKARGPGSRIALGFALCGVVLGLMSCAYPTRNQPAQTISPATGYRWREADMRGKGGTLVIVSMSGGGSRATALALSVLEGLNSVQLANNQTLADNIDIVSSVSGGSVAAAYFALKGVRGFDELKSNFIDKNGTKAILMAGLNPVGLARLSTPSVERIDLLIDYLDRTLFTKGETYQDLISGSRQPFLILNAADMVSERPFAITQNNFDLLCSDLSKLKLSTAVAASAAFPLALSPVTLKDYSVCPAQGRNWPPTYVTNDAKTPWYDEPVRANRGRALQSYALGEKAVPPTGYVHLLDGGIADNLGVAEPVDILTRNSPAPGLLNAMARGSVRNIVFVMINARSFSASKLGEQQATPGLLDMLGATIDSSIDNATAGAAARLRSVLGAKFAEDASVLRDAGDAAGARNLMTMMERTHLIEVDFDAIEKADCRQKFHGIPTDWSLTDGDAKALMVAGKALLGASREFGKSVAAVGGHTAQPLPTIDDACAAIEGH